MTNKTKFMSVLLAFCAMCCLPVNAQFHGIGVYKNIVSAQPANVGDTVTAVIGVINLDEFNDTITVTSIVDVVHHVLGDEVSDNLVPVPVNVAPGEFFEVSVTYQVLALDNTLTNQWTAPLAVLQDNAFITFILNRDGLGEVGVPQTAIEDYSNGTLVQQPPQPKRLGPKIVYPRRDFAYPLLEP